MFVRKVVVSKFFCGLMAALAWSSAVEAQPVSDLKVRLDGPASPLVYEMATYSATVSNIGNQNAAGVKLTIQLPRTGTSPQVYVLGDLGDRDSRCSRVGTTLQCNLDEIRKGKSTIVSFDFRFPQSTRTLSLAASATTTSVEATTTNNGASLTPALAHIGQVISGDVLVQNSHCTGTRSNTGLSSYFECELYPSSISSHAVTLHRDRTISIAGYPGFSGAWQQPTDGMRLTFQYFEEGMMVASFDGWSVGNGCFEGITSFFPDAGYIAVYEVCMAR